MSCREKCLFCPRFEVGSRRLCRWHLVGIAIFNGQRYLARVWAKQYGMDMLTVVQLEDRYARSNVSPDEVVA